ncbi:hypothetical protein P0F65_14070 [Sphingomonas sp. I4]
MTFCNESGSRPTMRMPLTGFSSLSCWKPISAWPCATIWPTGVAGIMRPLGRTWSAMPSLSSITDWI